MSRLLALATLLAAVPLLMAPINRPYVDPNNTTPTAQQVAAANNPARAYADIVNVAVTLDLKSLHPAVDKARLDCWTAGGQGGGGLGSLTQTLTAFQAGPQSGEFAARAYAEAAAKMHQLEAQGPYYKTTFSQELPVTGRAYQGTQNASFAVLPVQLQDSATKKYYSPAAFLTHCQVFLHDPTGMGNWRPAMPVLTEEVPATQTNFEFVVQGSKVEAYIVTDLAKQRPADAPR
jgi:hypothetical protein